MKKLSLVTRGCWFACLQAAIAVSCLGAAAQFSSAPREDSWFPSTAGLINTLTESGGVLYAGGTFNSWMPAPIPSLLNFDLTSGLPRSDFPTVYGTVTAIIPDEEGGWYIGGRFNGVGNVIAQNLAHVRRDKTVDPDWKPDPDATYGVEALLLVDNILYVGGTFANIGSEARNAIAAIDVRTGRVTPWNPNITSGYGPLDVSFLGRSGQNIYAAGSFRTIGGQPRQGLAALDMVTGQVTDWNPQLVEAPSEEATVYQMLVAEDTVVLSWVRNLFIRTPTSSSNAGTWVEFAGFDVHKAVRKWDVKANDSIGNPTMVNWLALAGRTVYASGNFDQIGGRRRFGLAAVDLNTGEIADWNPNALSGDGVGQLSYVGGPMVISGDVMYTSGVYYYLTPSGSVRGLVAVNLTSGQAWRLQGDPAAASGVPLLVSGSTLFARGSGGNDPFQQAPSGTHQPLVAALDATTGKLLDWKLPVSDFGGVDALALDGGSLFLGADLSLPGNPPQLLNHLLSASAATGELKTWSPSLNPTVARALAAADGRIYVAGQVSTDPADFSHVVASVDATTGATIWSRAVDRFVWDMKVSDGIVYIAGSFSTVDGIGREGVAALTADTGAVTEWNPRLKGSASTLLLSGNLVYLGGAITEIGGAPRHNLGAVDRLTGQLSPFSPEPDGPVWKLASGSNVLVVAGTFNQIGGAERKELAAIDLESGLILDWDPRPSHQFMDPYSIAVTEKAICVTGPFTTIGGRYRPKFAIFPLVGSPEVVNQPEDREAAAGQEVRWSVQVLGEPPLQYQWTRNGAAIPDATSPTLVLANTQPTDSGVYALIISNSVGVVTSRSANCRVLEPVAIQQGPISQQVDPGSTVVLAVTASGTAPLAYQWRLNGVNIPGQVFPTLTLPYAQAAQAGSYSVAVANSLGAVSSSAAELTVRTPALPFADGFSDAGTIASLGFTGSGNNTTATAEAGEPRHAHQEGGKSLWLHWHAPASGVVVLDTRGSSFDTLLAVYTGTNVDALQEVASDGDSGGYLTSLVKFSAVQDTDYQIAVDGLQGASGDVMLNCVLSPEAGELPRLLAVPESQTVVLGQEVIFRVAASNPSTLYYRWFFNSMPLPNETNDTLVILQVTAADVGLYSVEIRNASGAIQTEPVSLQITSEESSATNSIAVASEILAQDKLRDVLATGQRAGLQSLTVRAASEPGIVSLAPGAVGFQMFNTFAATKEPAEPNHCGQIGGASYWLPLKVQSDGVLTVSTEGSDFNTLLAVYTSTGKASEPLLEVASDDNSGRDGEDSILRLRAKAGTIYYVAVDGVNDAKGFVRLSYALDSAKTLPSSELGHGTGGASPVLQLRAQGILGRTYRVQTSNDLTHWSDLMTTSLTNANSWAIPVDPTQCLARFFRVVPIP